MASLVSDLSPGVEFGGYIVREQIGRGAMASVYCAEHVLLKKLVALKVMDRSLLARVGGRERFLREGRAVAAIQHPNVVNITDVGVYDQVPYLVMELLSGETLEAHLLERGPLADADAVRLALPTIAALSAAHASGVVHRDVKPSNIFLSLGPSGEVVPKVLDFGISRVSFEHTGRDLLTTPHDHIVGTPLYLAPEALRGQSLGPAADQYSLGVVLYQCVTGRTPFAGDTLASLFGALSRGEFERPTRVRPGISPALERVIATAMSPDPADRYPTLRDMGNALFELAAERTQLVWGNSFRSPEAHVRSLAKVPQQLDHALSTQRSSPWGGGRQRLVLMALGLWLATLGSAMAWLLRGQRATDVAPARPPPGAAVTEVTSAPVAGRTPASATPATPATPAARTTGGNASGSHAAAPQVELAAKVPRVVPAPVVIGPEARNSVRHRGRPASIQARAPVEHGHATLRTVTRNASAQGLAPSPAISAAALAPASARSSGAPAPPERQRRRGANGAPFLD